MPKELIGVTIHNVSNEAEMENIDVKVHRNKCKATWHKNMTQCKVKGTEKQIDAFVEDYRSY